MKKSAAMNMRGFTLIELAVVIVIVALVLGALLVPLATQIQTRQVKETRDRLADIKEALLGFAVTQGRLPCPDTDRDGVENACTGAGSITDVVEGFLPWQDLGVPPTDTWDHIFRYAVTREFAETAQPGVPPANNQLDLADVLTGRIEVITRGDNPATSPAPVETKSQIRLAANVPALVMSVGSNGLGGSRLGGTDSPFAVGTDEATNVSSITSVALIPPFFSRRFIQRTHTSDNAGCSDTAEGQPFCEFDDQMIWISAPVLLNRMVEARQLP